MSSSKRFHRYRGVSGHALLDGEEGASASYLASADLVELTQHLVVRYVLDSPPIAREDFLADTARLILDLAYSGAPPGASQASLPGR